jgi:hypothetical protein
VWIDKEGVKRIMRSLELRKAWIGLYRNLVMGGVTHQICGQDFNTLLLRIAREAGGFGIAIEILYMRLRSDEGRAQSSPSQLIDIGCELMRRLTFTGRNKIDEYRLGIVARHCLLGEKGAATVREVFRHLKDAVSQSRTYPFYHADLITLLFTSQPLAALEGLCGDDPAELALGINILDQAGQLRRNAFDAIPEADLIAWCDRSPGLRYPAVAAGVTPFHPSGDAERLQWTTIAHQLLDRAPDRVAVLRKFTDELAWAGSSAAVIESSVRLLDELAHYPDPALIEFIVNEKTRFAEAIQTEKLVQQSQEIIEGESFERFE